MNTKGITKLKAKQRLLRDEWKALKVLADTPQNQKRIKNLELRGRRIKIAIDIFEAKKLQEELV